MLLFRTDHGVVIEEGGERFRLTSTEWDAIFRSDDVPSFLAAALAAAEHLDRNADVHVHAPVESQEVWAAGVTWQRSRTARMEESEAAGGSNFYDKVYSAERPELFLKATPHRVVGPGATMLLRDDSRWIVPEPELTVAVSSHGTIFGYTIGNDLSCRDIEGENPLYLPQAKVFDACAAAGPAILIQRQPPAPDSRIHLEIARDGAVVFQDSIALERLKRSPAELVGWLTRHNTLPAGCLLMTGTGIVPPDDFCLAPGDQVRIAIDGIGELVNVMAAAPASD